ncbi:MAG TPA: STN domain-containing protein [Urbifossiella sp.]|jgi:hypothetical protein|nr:STN domain-containing protein [Urbifossiella sp.]
MTHVRFAAALAAVLAGLAAASAQPPFDGLEAARARQQLADQKATSVVQTALVDADRLARTNPPLAAQQIRSALASIEQLAVSVDTRRTLTNALQAKLAVVEGRPAGNPGPRPDPATAGVKAAQSASFDALQTEVREVHDGVETIARLRGQNRYADADQIAASLARRYPNNPAVLSLGQKDNFAAALADSRAFADMQGKRIVMAQNDLMRSSFPAKGDIEFPADWTTRAGKRTNEIKLTDKEKTLIAALNKPVTLTLKDQPLEYALQELSTQMDEKLLIDQKSLRDLDIDLKRPVSLDGRGVSARTALRQVLATHGLTFVVKDEVIQIVTVERSRDMLVTRVYYLGDLIQGVGPFGGALKWGPLLDFQQTQENAKLIVDSIQTSVDPLAWHGKGGAGTVTFHFPSMSLIVRAPSEVHAALGSRIGR